MKTIFTTKSLVILCLSFAFWFQASPLMAQINTQLSNVNNNSMVLSDDTPPQLISVNDKSIVPKISESVILHKSVANVNSLLITIIESQSENSAHNMDLNWQTVATNMGHTATILPQTTLDNTDFFSTTDILIISSGVIGIPMNRRVIIQQFIEQGGPVYLQSEYLSSYETNITFQAIVNNLGGTFSWEETTSGDLIPMNITGDLSIDPNTIPNLSYFWYGNVGSGDATIESNMEYAGQYYGFIFTPPSIDQGIVISNSDQDWAREAEEKEMFMENIITYLSATITGIDEKTTTVGNSYKLHQNYPNPFYVSTEITYLLPESGTAILKIVNLLGSEVQTIIDEKKPAGEYTAIFNADNIPEGIYFCTLLVNGTVSGTIKMIVKK